MTGPRLVLFGAGASYGSSGIYPCSPPLGAKLYPSLRRVFPLTWGAFRPDLAAAFDEHFELGMAELMRVYPAAVHSAQTGAPSPHLLMRDMARYFLAFELSEGMENSYAKFALRLLSHPHGLATRFATLNYEHLLEQALVRLGLRPAVLRPHGGAQLWPAQGGQVFVDPSWALGLRLHSVSAHVKPRSARWTLSRLREPQQAKYPCMAMYMPGKATQVGQRFLRRHQHRLRQVIRESRTIVLVGVRPWTGDDHMWPEVFDARARVLYVGGQGDFEVLAERRPNVPTEHIGEQFDRTMNTIVDEM